MAAEIPYSSETEASPEVMLAKAALSHLELALRSVAAHATHVTAEGWQLVSKYRAYLQNLEEVCCDGMVKGADRQVAHDHKYPPPSVKLIALDVLDDTAHEVHDPPLFTSDGDQVPEASSRPPGGFKETPKLARSGIDPVGSAQQDRCTNPSVISNARTVKTMNFCSETSDPRSIKQGVSFNSEASEVGTKSRSCRGYSSEASVLSHTLGGSIPRCVAQAGIKSGTMQGYASEASILSVTAGGKLPSCIAKAESSTLNKLESMRAWDGDAHTTLEDWQLRMLDIFEQLDRDGDGSIDRKEIREAFDLLGLPHYHRAALLKEVDESKDGRIEYLEWLHMLENMQTTGNSAVKAFVQALADRQAKNGRIYPAQKKVLHRTILNPDGRFRMCWDLLLVLALAIVALGMPFSMAFGPDFFPEFNVISDVLDGLFMLDVLLNFRTAFIDENGAKVYNPRRIAVRYLKTWFLLDIVSSLPFEHLTTGLLPNMQPAKLLKLGKAIKGLKMLRLGKAVRLSHFGELTEWLEDQSTSLKNQNMVKLLGVLTFSVVVCHWLACFMVLSGDQWLLQYEFVSQALWTRYVAALYWAMTTVTTVGYGDITPKTDWERAYASVAMVIGGCFYAYIVGSVSSILTASDINSSAYNERMGLVQAWLNFHDELPAELRRRIRRHFKELLTRKSALDDNAVLNDLSPDLRHDVALCLVHEDVRFNGLFRGLPPHGFSRLMLITQRVHCDAEEKVVEMGDTAMGMYILVEGGAKFQEGHQWRENHGNIMLGPGDSFGEEALLGLERTYTYTIVTTSSTVFHHIPQERFAEMFKVFPDFMDIMRSNFVGDHASSSTHMAVFSRGRASVSNAGSSHIPPGFSEVVIESFDELAKSLDELRSRVEGSSSQPLSRTQTSHTFASEPRNTTEDMAQESFHTACSRGNTRRITEDAGTNGGESGACFLTSRTRGRLDTFRLVEPEMNSPPSSEAIGGNAAWKKNLTRDLSSSAM